MKYDRKTSDKLVTANKNKLFSSPESFIHDLNHILYWEPSIDVSFEEKYAIKLSKLDIHQNRFFDAEKILLNIINNINHTPEQVIQSVRLLNKLYLSQQHADRAFIIIDDTLSEFKSAGNIKSTIELKLEKGKLHFHVGELNKALGIFSELIENHTKHFGKHSLAELYHWAGCTYLWTGELDVAVNYLNAGIKLSKENNEIYTEIKCSLVLAGLNLLQGKTEKSIEQLKFSYSNIDSGNISLIEINILTVYACHYFIQNDYGKSLEYLEKTIALINRTEFTSKYYLIFKMLSSVYQKREEFDEAKQAENKCLTLLEEYSKIGKGKQALLHYPSFSIFEMVVNHALKHSSFDANDSLVDSNTKTINVLAIDDNKLNLFFTRKVLSNKGYQSHIASNFNQAKKLLSEKDMDVILMDIQMPVMNGYEMYEALVNDNLIKKGKTKVVAMTGYDSAKDKERAYKLGMDDYLTKPFTPEQLNACINKLINEQMDPIENALQNQTYTYASLLEDKFGFNEAENQKFLNLLSHQIRSTEKLIYESISLKNCNELLQVMHDLRSNMQMIGENKILHLIGEINENIKDTDTLFQHVDKIEDLVNALSRTQEKMSTELKQRK